MWSRLARESDDLAGDLTLLDDAERARAERFRREGISHSEQEDMPEFLGTEAPAEAAASGSERGPG